MTHIINGKELAEKIQIDLAEQVKLCKKTPNLAVILVGDDPASLIYVNNKKKVADKIGIESNVYHLSPIMTQDALIAFIQELNANPDVNGILVQLPLPTNFNTDDVINAIDPKKDVDGLHPINQGNLFSGKPTIIPCTPLGCLKLIESVTEDITGKLAIIIGRSRLVGRPMASLLLNKNCTVIQAHSKTKNLPHLCQQADILIAAIGQPNFITKQHIKKDALLIDVGINKTPTTPLTGDINFNDAQTQAAHITPVPGGVGPMTITMLMHNTIQVALAQAGE